MRLRQTTPRAGGLAFTLVEVLVSVAIIGIMFVSLYAGITSGFAVVQLARENLRATQIMLEKTETMRLYSWSQINSNGFIPSTFTAYFFPAVQSSSSLSSSDSVSSVAGSGTLYSGTVVITNAPVSSGYSDNMRLVIITVSWQSGEHTRTREMQTLVSQNGLQPYIY
ncbi:MAG: type II secretion system protein [Verrucomicrobiota bacterium]